MKVFAQIEEGNLGPCTIQFWFYICGDFGINQYGNPKCNQQGYRGMRNSHVGSEQLENLQVIQNDLFIP